MKPVKVSINATTGRDESVMIDFEVDPRASLEEAKHLIDVYTKVLDHRRGTRNLNFMKYRQITAEMPPEVYEACRVAIDFLYGNEIAGVQADQPHLAPVLQGALDQAVARAKANLEPTEQALKVVEGDEVEKNG